MLSVDSDFTVSSRRRPCLEDIPVPGLPSSACLGVPVAIAVIAEIISDYPIFRWWSTL